MSTTRRIATVAVTAVTALVSARSAFAQATQGDHWKYVPPLATTCFAGDDFDSKLNAAVTAINAEIERQDKVNAAAKAKFESMDMMEKAQRMQAFMMKNPQAAAKMMQAQQTTAAAATSAVSEGNESVQQLNAELERHKASFRSALEQAVKPVQARQLELIKAKTVLVGEVQQPMFTHAADHAQYVQLVAEENAVIEKACTPFFGANGTFPRWLARWRAAVTEKIIIAGEGADVVAMQMAAMDLPDGGYRSTNPLQQVGNYLRTVSDVFGVRPAKALPSVDLKK